MFAGMYVKLIAAAIIVAAVLGGVFYVKHLQSSVAELTTENATLTSKLVDQNNAIDALKQDADARLKAGEALIAAAKEETKKAKGRSTIIYKTKPSTPGDDCKSALDLVNSTPQAAEQKALELVNGGKK
jgi:peptidoglycan hydrolase CwlO-like protein